MSKDAAKIIAGVEGGGPVFVCVTFELTVEKIFEGFVRVIRMVGGGNLFTNIVFVLSRITIFISFRKHIAKKIVGAGNFWANPGAVLGENRRVDNFDEVV